jgi:hypothetical protein
VAEAAASIQVRCEWAVALSLNPIMNRSGRVAYEGQPTKIDVLLKIKVAMRVCAHGLLAIKCPDMSRYLGPGNWLMIVSVQHAT